MPLLIAGTASSWKKVDAAVSDGISAGYEKAAPQDSTPSMAWVKPVPKQALNALAYKPIPKMDTGTKLVFGSVINAIDSQTLHPVTAIYQTDNTDGLAYGDVIHPHDLQALTPFYGALPAKDRVRAHHYHAVYRFKSKPVRVAYEFYIPSFNFEYAASPAKLTFNFTDPDTQEPYTLPSPVDSSSAAPWDHTRKADIYNNTKYGHSRHYSWPVSHRLFSART